jgi:hypothetical protein
MAAQDYKYDPSGQSPENTIEGEVHPLSASVGVFPTAGPFFRHTLSVEGSYDGVRFTPLTARIDYRFSPLFMRPSADLGREINSYIVVHGDWQYVRLSYQALGQYEDVALLTEVARLNFNRRDPRAWTQIRAQGIIDPSSFNREWKGLGEAEAVSQGFVKIKDAIERLKGQGDKATLEQVTALELRQTEVETLVDGSEANVSDLMAEFANLWELYHTLEDYFLHGGQGNTHYPEGYTYNSDGALDVHTVVHGLNTDEIHCDFWQLDLDGNYVPFEGQVRIADVNQIELTIGTPTKVIGVVRPASDFGYVYTADTESSVHTVAHNLDTGFPAISVWRQSLDGWVKDTQYTATLVDGNTITVSRIQPAVLRVVVEPPTPRAFIFKAQDPALRHLITHYLRCQYFTLTLWVKGSDGDFKEIAGEPSVVLPSLNHLDVELTTASEVKAVLHPVGLTEVNFDQDLQAKQIELEDTQSRIEARLTQITEAIDLLSIVTTYEYDSSAPSLVHTVTHSLDSVFVEATVWVDDGNGNFQIEYPTITGLDKDRIIVSLTESANVHVMVRRGRV